MTEQEAYELGRCAISILDNPFWKNYPNEPLSGEATLSRHFVEGYCSKLKEENKRASV